MKLAMIWTVEVLQTNLPDTDLVVVLYASPKVSVEISAALCFKAHTGIPVHVERLQVPRAKEKVRYVVIVAQRIQVQNGEVLETGNGWNDSDWSRGPGDWEVECEGGQTWSQRKALVGRTHGLGIQLPPVFCQSCDNIT